MTIILSQTSTVSFLFKFLIDVHEIDQNFFQSIDCPFQTSLTLNT